MRAHELAKDRAKIMRAKGHRHADAQQATERLLIVSHGLRRLLQLRDGGAGLLMKHAAPIGRRHAAAGAVQQFHPQRGLQMRHALADHRLGDRQPRGRAADAAALHHGEEGLDLVEAVFHACTSIYFAGGV